MILSKADCGMLLAVKKSPSAVAYCALSIRCGTRDENGFPEGTAHFTEHALFKGTSKKSSSVINSYLDSLGGDLDAYTSKEEIVLNATVLKEDLPKAVSLLLELATCPTFPKREIETERSVILEEIKSYKDSPADDIADTFESMLFKGHPLSRSILGSEESVMSITPDSLREFFRGRFKPQDMAFSVCADKDEKRLEEQVRKVVDRYFPSCSENALWRRECSAPPENFFNVTLEKGNHDVNAVIGGRAPSLHEEKSRHTALLLLNNILAGPFANSILNKILREKNGWVYNVESDYTQYSDAGIFEIGFGCDRDNVEKCCRAIDKEILRLQTLPLSERRLKAAKKQFFGQMAISSDNWESECQRMGGCLLDFGDIEPDETLRRKIEEITSEDIMEMARKIFAPGKVSRLIYL